MAIVTTTAYSGSNAKSPIAGILHLSSGIVDLGGYTAADTFQLFTVPAGSVPLAAAIEIIEDAGETCTIDVGITGGDVDGLIDGADLNQAAGTAVGGAGDDLCTAIAAAETTYHALAVTGSTYAAGKFRVHAVFAAPISA